MLAENTWRLKRALRTIRDEVEGDDRFVDFGVLIRVVERDMEHGKEILAGKPPLRVVGEHLFGGVVDTKQSPPAFVRPPIEPVVVTLSPAQWKLVQHGDELPLRLMAYGSMGAGKTTMLAAWLTLRLIESTGIANAVIGVTAPTNPRMTQIKEMIGGLAWKGGGMWPRAWFRWKEQDRRLYCANGVAVEFRSTHRSSKAEGSPIQGQNWIACASDELQDSVDVDGDIEARGRAAPNGQYKRFNTVTAKDHPEWRSFRARCASSEFWGIYQMLGPDSPFVHPSYWDQLKSTMTKRDYERKVLCHDIASDDRVYTAWNRALNVRHYPMIGARDVTESVLRSFGALQPYGYLIGHDPGEATDVSVFLKAFMMPGAKDYVWFVMGEITSKNCTGEEHARKVLRWLHEHHVCQVGIDGRLRGSGAIALCDPQTDRDVYRVWKHLGIAIRPAAYKPGTRDPMRIGREMRIDVVNTLICDASNNRRLFVHADNQAQPCAPKLVQAFEMSERNADGRSEHERKDATDLSHWPAAVGYALYDLERPRLQAKLKAVK